MDRRFFIKATSLAGLAAFLPSGCGSPALRTPEEQTDGMLADLVEAAIALGAEYADARFLAVMQDSVQVRQSAVFNASQNANAGIGVRVYKSGGWGYAASSEWMRTTPRALAVEAVAQAELMGKLNPLPFSSEGRLRGQSVAWATPFTRDPFSVPLSEKAALLTALTARAMSGGSTAYAVANLFSVKRETRFLSSYNARIRQTEIATYPNLGVTAFDRSNGQIDNRTSSMQARAGGYETVSREALEFEVDALVKDVIELQKARPLTPLKYDIIMHPSYHWRVITELLAPHLDPAAVFGLDGAAPSRRFLSATDAGTKKIASEQLSIRYDSGLPGGLATFGWDDGGRAAAAGDVVKNGVFTGFPCTDEFADLGTQKNGPVRGASWDAPPRFTMPNLVVVPSASGHSLDDMIRDTQLGLLLAGRGRFSVSTDRTWFRGTAEQAWLIESGEKTKLVRDFEFEAPISDFFNAISEVGGAAASVNGGDLFTAVSAGVSPLPFTVSTPPVRYTGIPTFSTLQEKKR